MGPAVLVYIGHAARIKISVQLGTILDLLLALALDRHNRA